MNKEEKVCRLCLTIIDCDCGVIDEVARYMISVLSLGLDLSATENPIICTTCAEKLHQFYGFKTSCAQAYDPLRLPSANDDTNIDYVCSFCKRYVEKELFVSIRDFEKKSELIRDMLVKCLPELDFSLYTDFSVCRHCLDSLNGFFSFMMTCQNVEVKIKGYRRTEGLVLDDKLKLSKIIQEASSNTKLSNVDQPDNVDIIKKEEKLDELDYVVDTIIKDEYIAEEEDFKVEAEDECVVERDSLCGNATPHLQKNPSELNKLLLNIHIFKCEACPYETTQKSHFTRHLLVHKDISEITMYQCEICPFKSKQKYLLKRHALTHKDVSEITIYKCDLCPYQSRQKAYLKRHLLVHKDRSEMPTYNCEKCAYKTIRRRRLKRHMLTHETKTYRCESCPYETNHRKPFTKHLLIHESKSEVTIYNCEKCPYKATKKNHLKLHEVTHKDISETVAYKCDLCRFATKRKQQLASHMLKHKDKSEITMYKCGLCPYEAKRKHLLTRHMINHKDCSETGIFKCTDCPYITKQEVDYKEHLVTHRV